MTEPLSLFVVGIAGGSAAGKSSFSAALKKALSGADSAIRVDVLGMDRYFYRDAPGGPMFHSLTLGDMPNANHPNSADNARLAADVDAMRVSSDAPDVLVIEGLMALYVEEIRSRLDLRLYIELDADERALRRLLRDMSGARGNSDPQFIATYYRECARFGHHHYVEPSRVHADLILRGDADFERTAELVADVIRARRAAPYRAGGPSSA